MADDLLTRPVKDLSIASTTTLSELLRQFDSTGGFVAAKLATAVDILKQMKAVKEESGCTVFFSFPADIISTGCRGVIRDMIRSGLVDVVMTTCGTLDHDLARCLADYYCGTFEMDDASLRDEGVNRLGNVLVPDTSYGIALENFMQPVLTQLHGSKKTGGTDEERNSPQLWTGVELIRQFGLLLPELMGQTKADGSLLYWAAKNEIPIFVPGLSDGAFGSQLWQFYQSHRDFTLDVLAEEHMLSDIVFEAKATGALMVGGGISKHHTIWWNQFRGGLDYAVQVTTAPEWDGSLSGARVREAVSWGKVRPEARRITVEGDATILLPLLAAAML